MRIVSKQYWVFTAGIVGVLALSACNPPPLDPEGDASSSTASIGSAASPTAKSIDALTGLKIQNFGPMAIKSSSIPGKRVDIWASADRSLEGYKAALWLNGQALENTAISGVTVTGTVPAALLTKPGTLSLEIRVGENGIELTSEKVDLTIE